MLCGVSEVKEMRSEAVDVLTGRCQRIDITELNRPSAQDTSVELAYRSDKVHRRSDDNGRINGSGER